VLILGAGVAGLQAIATARRLRRDRLGVPTLRPAVKEQVESLGAKFLMMEQQVVAEGAGGYAKSLSGRSAPARARFLGQERQRRRRGHHDRGDPGKRARSS